MAQRRTWIAALGCVVVMIGLSLGLVAIAALVHPTTPQDLVLTLRLDRPISEVAADDPLAELMGEAPLSLSRVRAALAAAAEDERVHGVRVRVDRFASGFAVAQEIRSLLERVSAAGKWTASYLDTAGEFVPGNLEYYVASGCDELSLNPMGDVNLIGISARSPFIRGTFDKLGVRPEFPGRGDYKTARFMYTERGFTPAHREMLEWLVDSLMGQLTRDIGSSRGLEPEQVAHLVDGAPHLGDEAVQAGLVDYLEDWSGFVERLEAKDATHCRTMPVSSYARRLHERRGAAKIAVVTAVGAIMRGESRRDLNPLLGGDVMGADTVARAWRRVRSTRGVKAAIFRVDSPGGSAVASEVIRSEVQRTAAEIPVVVSMSNVAASGGYWISCCAQRIVADPGTLTASIGVFAGHLNLDRFWSEKLGVTFGRIDRGANANLYGELEDWSDAQRAVIDRELDRIYGAFVERVADGREMEEDAVRAIGSGRVFTGLQAKERGLVDVVGGFDAALAEARELAGLAPDAPLKLIDFPRPRPWWQRLAHRRSEEEAAVQRVAALLNRGWETGLLESPGVVWMPPVYIR